MRRNRRPSTPETIAGLALLSLLMLLPLSCERREPTVRHPTVAGKFYPANPQDLRLAVTEYLGKAKRLRKAPAQALLVPHAGYFYSGQVAADAFVQADPAFERVFILAANHTGTARYHGVSVDDHDLYSVPGTEVAVSKITRTLLQDPLFLISPPANSKHMVEVEIPFLLGLKQRSGGGRFEIVPMVLGKLSDQEITEVAALLDRQGGDRPLYVFSMDLSHYFPYKTAETLDRSCLKALIAKDQARVSRCTTDSTDRNSLLLILLALANLRQLEPDLVTYRNSGDVTGDGRRVVGYAAVAFRPGGFALSNANRKTLLAMARATLTRFVRSGVTYNPEKDGVQWPELLSRKRASFVTLRKNGVLRGCIGSLRAIRPLWQDVRDNTIAAASADPRFPPVDAQELDAITLEVSVLSEPRPLRPGKDEEIVSLLRPGIDGVVLTFRGRRSTYLPEVWTELPDPSKFLSRLCRKQGSPSGCWKSPEARFETYQSTHLGPG